MNGFILPMELPRFEVALVDLTSTAPIARYLACQALGQAESSRQAQASEALIGALEDPVEEVRVQAVEGLCQLVLGGATVPGEPLVTALSDPADAVRCSALENLDLFADNAVRYARQYLQDPSPGMRRSAVRLLGDAKGCQEDDSTALLGHALSDEDELVRREAALALGQRGDPSAATVLWEMVDHGGDEALQAIFALGGIPGQDVRNGLSRILDRPFAGRHAKAAAAAALARQKDDVGTAALAGMLKARRSATRIAALQSLAVLPSLSMCPALVQMVRTASSEAERSMSLNALSMAVPLDPQAINADLRSLLKDLDGDLREELEEIIREKKDAP